MMDRIILFGKPAIFCYLCGDIVLWETRDGKKRLLTTPCEHCAPLLGTIEESRMKSFIAERSMTEPVGEAAAKVSVRRKREARKDAKAAASLLKQRRRVVSSQLDFARQVN